MRSARRRSARRRSPAVASAWVSQQVPTEPTRSHLPPRQGRFLIPTAATRRRLLAMAAAVATALLPQACGPRPPDGIVLVGATVIDGRGGPPKSDMVVV